MTTIWPIGHQSHTLKGSGLHLQDPINTLPFVQRQRYDCASPWGRQALSASTEEVGERADEVHARFPDLVHDRATALCSSGERSAAYAAGWSELQPQPDGGEGRRLIVQPKSPSFVIDDASRLHRLAACVQQRLEPVAARTRHAEAIATESIAHTIGAKGIPCGVCTLSDRTGGRD